eukprot:scpid38277/ scgid6132/ Nucleosome assembly protein 1-like 1-B; Nucleosome assembly protein 1
MSSDEGTSVDAPMPGAGAAGKSQLTSKLLADPGLMQAFGSELQSLVGAQSSYIDSMPAVMKGRIRALKNLQADHFKLEAKFYEEVQALERKYSDLRRPNDVKRRDIVTGTYEPTEEEAELDFEQDEDDEDEMDDEEESSGAKIMDVDEFGEPIKDESAADKVKYDENTAGIPEFWLTALKHIDVTADMIEETDEPLLRCLTDIELKHHEEPLGFDLIFHFSENKYFTNECLVKHYEMKIEYDEEDPFSFDGPQIIGVSGCEINWQKGNNLTVKTVKKKQKGKGKGQPGKTVTKQVPAETFFSFFSPPELPEEDEDETELTEEQQEAVRTVASDYEAASFIRDNLIPKAVLFFTGEADGNGEGMDMDGMFPGFGGMDDEDDEEGMAARLPARAGGRVNCHCCPSARANMTAKRCC